MSTKRPISTFTYRLARLLRTSIPLSGTKQVRFATAPTFRRKVAVPIVFENNRPTWAEISLRNLRDNFKSIQRYVGPQVQICAVVKADAYRHGLVECSTALQEEGATWFGVTSTEEGVQLRRAGIQGRILLMTGFWHGDEDAIIAQGLTPAVWENWHLVHLQQASRRHNSSMAVHLKVDTGMARLGVLPSNLGETTAFLQAHPEIRLEGIFTHLASAEELAESGTGGQLSSFREAVRSIRQAGFSPKYLHAANSAAIVSRSDARLDMVRPGISLYGYYLPFTGRTARPIPKVVPVLSWKTRIISMKCIVSGQRIGYNGTYTATRASRIAVLPVGYADGLNRQLSSQGKVLIHGECAPIVGRISMDLTLIDVTDVAGAQIGDEVTLLGASGQRAINAADHASLASTIPYEILCNISKRVPRHFTDHVAP